MQGPDLSRFFSDVPDASHLTVALAELKERLAIFIPVVEDVTERQQNFQEIVDLDLSWRMIAFLELHVGTLTDPSGEMQKVVEGVRETFFQAVAATKEQEKVNRRLASKRDSRALVEPKLPTSIAAPKGVVDASTVKAHFQALDAARERFNRAEFEKKRRNSLLKKQSPPQHRSGASHVTDLDRNQPPNVDRPGPVFRRSLPITASQSDTSLRRSSPQPSATSSRSRPTSPASSAGTSPRSEWKVSRRQVGEDGVETDALRKRLARLTDSPNSAPTSLGRTSGSRAGSIVSASLEKGVSFGSHRGGESKTTRALTLSNMTRSEENNAVVSESQRALLSPDATRKRVVLSFILGLDEVMDLVSALPSPEMIFLDQQSPPCVFHYAVVTKGTRKQVGWASVCETNQTQRELQVFNRGETLVWRGYFRKQFLDWSKDELEHLPMSKVQWEWCDIEQHTICCPSEDEINEGLIVRAALPSVPMRKPLPTAPPSSTLTSTLKN